VRVALLQSLKDHSQFGHNTTHSWFRVETKVRTTKQLLTLPGSVGVSVNVALERAGPTLPTGDNQIQKIVVLEVTPAGAN